MSVHLHACLAIKCTCPTSHRSTTTLDKMNANKQSVSVCMDLKMGNTVCRHGLEPIELENIWQNYEMIYHEGNIHHRRYTFHLHHVILKALSRIHANVHTCQCAHMPSAHMPKHTSMLRHAQVHACQNTKTCRGKLASYPQQCNPPL